MAEEAIIQVATFPGIVSILSATMTLSHGITPSTCVLEIAPQLELPYPVGTLSFIYGDIELNFSDARVSYSSVRRGPDGLIQSVCVQDRRWRWQFGEISGDYNTRFQDPGQTANTSGKQVGNSLDPNFLRTPQQLATILLQAMAENNFDVSLMPNDSYPEVHWTSQNPAQALDSLCNSLGCRISLDANEAVVIWPVGVGHLLPEGPIMSGGAKAVVKPRPDSIKVVTGPSLFQADFWLYPVGQDVDGSIKPYWALSYAPQQKNAAGPPESAWDYEDPKTFTNLSDAPNQNGVSNRQLAQLSVWRWYKIGGTLSPQAWGLQSQNFLGANKITYPVWENLTNSGSAQGYDVPGYGKLPNFPTPSWLKKWLKNQEGTYHAPDRIYASNMLLPLHDEQVQTFVSGDASLRRIPAAVYGVYNDIHLGQQNTPADAMFAEDFHVDGAHAIVKFSRPVYMYIADSAQNGGAAIGKFLRRPAIIFLRTGFKIRDFSTGAYVRYERTFFFGDASGNLAAPIYRPEIVAEYYPGYAGGEVDTIYTNTAPPDPVGIECDDHINAKVAEYASDAFPQEITYAGIIPISTDGAIQQVTWSVSNTHGATTHVSRNDETNPYVTPFRQRRVFEQLRNEVIENLRNIANQQGKEYLDL